MRHRLHRSARRLLRHALVAWVRRSRPDRRRPDVRLATYAHEWIESRKRRGIRSAQDDLGRLRLHVLPVLGARRLADVSPKDVRVLVDGLTAEAKLAPATVRNVYSTLRGLFRDALVDGAIERNPCCLPRGVGGTRGAASRARRPAIFTREEARALWTHPKIPADRRVFYALLLFTGMRHGEAAGRRWRDLDESTHPLAALVVATQYENAVLKTGAPRVVPVHASLAAALTHWRDSGFEQFLGRAPSSTDYIVPSRTQQCRKHGTTLRNLQHDCKTIAITPRRTHDTRHTFISHARREGARSEVLQRITHNARRDVIDHYTHVEWEPLCEAISRLRL